MSRLPALTGRRSRVIAPLAITMTSLSLIAAGCGGSESDASGAAAAAKAAGYVPSSAPVYVEVSTDFDGPQWTQIDTLAKVFPAYTEARAELDRALTEDVDFESKVKPLLGGKAAVAVLDTPAVSPSTATTATSPEAGARAIERAAANGDYLGVVELAEGKEADAEALLAQQADGAPTTIGDVTVYREDDSFAAVVPGAILLSDDQADIKASIDARAAGGDRVLSGSDRFTEAFGTLPDQNFAASYIDVGTLVTQQVAAIPQGSAPNPLSGANLDMVEDTRVVAAATAEPEGVRVKGVVVGGPDAVDGTSFSPSLTEHVPADAIGYVGFQNLQGHVANAVEQVRANGGEELIQQAGALVPQLQPLLGVTLDDLRALTAGEHALVVTKGAPLPGVALALEVEDGARAATTLDSLRQKTPALVQQFRPGLDLPDWRRVPLEGGVQGWDLPVSATGGVTYGVDGTTAIIGSSPQVVRQVQRPVQPLSQSADFTAATAGMPNEVTSVVWVNVGEAVRLANALGAFTDEPDAYANLQKVKSVSGWTTGGDEQTFEIFVRIG